LEGFFRSSILAQEFKLPGPPDVHPLLEIYMLHFPFLLKWIAVAKVLENQQVYRSVAIWIISKMLQSHQSPIFTSPAQSHHKVYTPLEQHSAGLYSLVPCTAMRSTQTMVTISDIWPKYSGRIWRLVLILWL